LKNKPGFFNRNLERLAFTGSAIAMAGRRTTLGRAVGTGVQLLGTVGLVQRTAQAEKGKRLGTFAKGYLSQFGAGLGGAVAGGIAPLGVSFGLRKASHSVLRVAAKTRAAKMAAGGQPLAKVIWRRIRGRMVPIKPKFGGYLK